MVVATHTGTRSTEPRGWVAFALRIWALSVAFGLLFLVAPGAFAAQERMPLDGFGVGACNWNGCTVANLDEDPDGPGTDWATATNNNTPHDGHFTFGTPTQPLTPGANLQEFRASVRKDAACGTGTDPTARFELWENGALVQAGSNVSVTATNSCTQGTNCQVISYTWNATAVTNAANVEAKVFGTNVSGSPASRCAVDLGAVEWNAEVSAGATPATLSTPTSPFATITSVSATLGATIANDNGSAVTDYGTVWGTAAAPTGNALSAGTNPGAIPPILPFSHARADVSAQPPGTQLFFRGYADNGTRGYSPDGTFYLEPNQATGVTFSNVTSTNMRIDWNIPGTGPGDGSIVVVKQGSPVDSNPVDGIAHAASTVFQSGAQLGTGNYVVFRASGSQVIVSGLSPSTTYHVAVYQYAGPTAPTINYQQDTPTTGSRATTAAGSTPTLSTPTVSGILTTSATLGATIIAQGGSTISDYGTVWGTSPAPTGNELSAGGTPPGFPHVFTHGRSVLPQATLIYFRGYADNGTRGYSADGSFTTEIANQAQTVRFRPTRTVETELDFTWTRGSGDGVIVLMREGTAVDADPVDGIEYAPNAVFGNGAEIGTGNYVVYVGAGSALTVTGLFPDLTYHVAIYEFTGSGPGPDGIKYLQAAPERGNSGHNGLHAANCVECHFGTGNAHGSFQIPRDADQQTACESCHNATGPASAKVDFAIHTGPKYGVSVDCGSCHEVHNNNDFTTTDTHSGGTTAANIEWFRPDTTKYFPGALEPALLQANTGFFGWDDANSPWNGACQTCHQNTDWHRNDASLGPASHVHNSAADCRTCHSHDNGFRGVGGSCIDCHNQEREIGTSGTFRRQIVDNTGNATTGEFGSTFTSHHVNDGTGDQIVTQWDCVVCHAEGNAITGEPDGTYHQTDGVQLKDVDTGVPYADWSGLTSFERSSFCLSCHDADGATIITTRTDPDPDATTDPLNPFNDGITNSHEPNGFDGSPAPHSRGAVLDIDAKFDTLNASHHAVLGPAYVYQSDCIGAGDPHPCCTGAGTGPSCGLPFGPQVNNAIQGVRTDLDWNSVIDCEDCHYGSATTMLSAHGTANARYMLRDSSGADVQPADETTLLCLRCHDPSDSTSLYPEHDKGNHIDNSRNLFDIACLSCHGGGEFGGIHGVDGLVTDDNGGGSYNPNVFTYGSGLDLISTWSDFTDGGVSCSSNQTAALLDNCGQHGNQTYGRLPSRDDAAQRPYPQP